MQRLPSPLASLTLISGVLVGALVLSGCEDDDLSDAYGNFRATEITVSAEAQGRLVRFSVDEGDRLEVDRVVGLIDTTQLAIQRRTLQAQRQSLLAQRQATLAQEPEIAAQVAALRTQFQTAQRDLERTRRLFEDDAATARELDRREGEVAVLERQIEQAEARTGVVQEQAASIAAQMAQIETQIEDVERRIEDAHIANPEPGTVLTVIARQGETVQIGTPLYTVANLDTLRLRAYATGNQLPRLRLSMPVVVLVDDEEGGVRSIEGRITWIASEAQFTPTPIQTREERATLVYAFDVRVPNSDGSLKIGMPGEVVFESGGVGERENGR